MNLTCVKLDDLLLLEELREVLALWERHDLALHVLNVRFHIDWNSSTFVVIGSRQLSAHFPISNSDFIADLKQETADVHNPTIYGHVTVRDHLSGLKDRSGISQSPDCS